LPTVKRNFYKDYNPKIHGISKTVLASILSWERRITNETR
jgi:hypothetical protein